MIPRRLYSHVRFYKAYLSGREKFALKIQNIWRMYVSMKRFKLRLEFEAHLYQKNCAIKIQTFCRRWLHRRLFMEYISILKHAVNIILKHIRMFIAKYNYKKQKSAKNIQVWFKRICQERKSVLLNKTNAYLIKFLQAKRHRRMLENVLHECWNIWLKKIKLKHANGSCEHKKKESTFNEEPASTRGRLLSSTTNKTFHRPEALCGHTINLNHTISVATHADYHLKPYKRRIQGKYEKNKSASESCGRKETEYRVIRNSEVEYLNRYIRERCKLYEKQSTNEMIFGYWHSKSELDKIRGTVSNIAPFKKLDPFNIGLLRKHEFVRILGRKWKEIGCTLHFEELQSITATFQPHQDGFINYIKYAQFAREQERPCEIHSRIVCTKCTFRGHSDWAARFDKSLICERFLPISHLRPNLCLTCGSYIESHLLLPKSIEKYVHKRGRVLCAEEMRRIFRKKYKADLSFNLSSFNKENMINKPQIYQCNSKG